MHMCVIQYGGFFIDNGYEEVIVPSIWELSTFIEKAGPEIVNQMYAFGDKKGRDICLVPEITALIQEMWRDSWQRSEKQPMKVFYIQRCYRYERPQMGRYREFTQAGIEILGGNISENEKEARNLLCQCLDQFKVEYEFKPSVKRGLNYYTDMGFEVEIASLGAQKQVAGGGKYQEGVGWAIGVDRLLLTLKDESDENR